MRNSHHTGKLSELKRNHIGSFFYLENNRLELYHNLRIDKGSRGGALHSSTLNLNSGSYGSIVHT